MKLLRILRRLFMSKKRVLALCAEGKHVRGMWRYGTCLCPGEPPRSMTGWWCCCGYCGEHGRLVRMSKPETLFGPDD